MSNLSLERVTGTLGSKLIMNIDFLRGKSKLTYQCRVFSLWRCVQLPLEKRVQKGGRNWKQESSLSQVQGEGQQVGMAQTKHPQWVKILVASKRVLYILMSSHSPLSNTF